MLLRACFQNAVLNSGGAHYAAAAEKVKVEPSQVLKKQPSEDEEKISLHDFLGKQPPTELEEVQTKIKSLGSKISKLMPKMLTIHMYTPDGGDGGGGDGWWSSVVGG